MSSVLILVFGAVERSVNKYISSECTSAILLLVAYTHHNCI